MVRKYRKVPTVVEALQWTGSNIEQMKDFAGDKFEHIHPDDRIDDADAGIFDILHSTWVSVFPGNWIIKGVLGEFYPCDDTVFKQTYEVVE